MLIYEGECPIFSTNATRIVLENKQYTIVEDLTDYESKLVKLAGYEEADVNSLANSIVGYADFSECDEELIELLEEIIACDGNASYFYSHYVLRDRFIKGEEKIKETPHLYNYIVNYFDKGEEEAMLELAKGTNFYNKIRQQLMLTRYKSKIY